MALNPCVSVITLGVADVQKSAAFYERLGWKRSSTSVETTVFFNLGGLVLSLYGRSALAEDAHVADGRPGFSGVSIAQNQASKAEVERVLAEAVTAGATLAKAAEEVFWGGYSGYFADPDGHLWEIAYNPFWPLASDGRVNLPD